MAIKKVTAKKITVKKPLVKAQTGKQTPFQKGVSKGDFKASDTNYVRKYVKDVVSGANKLSPDAPKTTKGKKDYNKKLADAYKKTYGHTSPGTRAMEIRSTQGEYPYTEKEFRVKSQAGIPVIKPKESFNDAFKRAREQGYGTFNWNGKSYNTKLKDEKKSGGTTSSTKMQKGGIKDSNLSMRQRREIKYVDKTRNKQIKKLEKKGTADDPQLLIDFENRKATYGDKTRREYINEKANSTINSLKKGTLLPPRMEYRYNPGTRTSSDKMQKGGSTVTVTKPSYNDPYPKKLRELKAAEAKLKRDTAIKMAKAKRQRDKEENMLLKEKLSNKKKGGSTGDKKWIQKAINPAHKGYCTPMTKPTCTPKRKALAKTLKKMAKNR